LVEPVVVFFLEVDEECPPPFGAESGTDENANLSISDKAESFMREPPMAVALLKI
jgi:hypothetical protein